MAGRFEACKGQTQREARDALVKHLIESGHHWLPKEKAGDLASECELTEWGDGAQSSAAAKSEKLIA